LLALLRPVLAHRKFPVAAVEFLSKLAQSLGYERASLGFVVGHSIKVYAVSRHYEELSNAALPEVAAAMEESLQQDTALLYPYQPTDFPYIVAAHAELARLHGLSNALTMPLTQDGQSIGAITFESSKKTHLLPAQHWLIETLASEAGALLRLKWLLEQPLRVRLWLTFRQKLADPQEKFGFRLRLGAALLVGVCILVLLALPVSNDVSGHARLEARVQRVISAPIDGYLKEVRVRPGDRVKANQLLAELNGETLLTQQRKLEAEVAQQTNAVAEAMVKGDRAQLAMARAKLDDVTAQKDLLDQQLAHTRLVAPFDGVVIKGDLTQLLGSPLRRSDVLLTLSQGSGFRVIIEVDERDISDIQLGQRGTLVLSALPSEQFSFQVTRLTLVANTTTEGKNVFEVEAALDSGVQKLAPGLKGIAKISIGNQPIGWQWAAHLWHALSYALWSRLG